MWRRTGSQQGWQDVIAPLQQEVTSYGKASLVSLQTAVNAFASGLLPATNTSGALDSIVFVAQQLSAHQYSSSNSTNGSNDSTTVGAADATISAPHQEQLMLLATCVAFCGVLKSFLASPTDQQQQQRPHRWQQQQQQHSEQLLPNAAATALCSCFRQWADQQTFSSNGSSNGGAAAAYSDTFDLHSQLQQAAVDALAGLLPKQLPAIAAHERAAVLALLLSLIQTQRRGNSSSSSSSSSGVSQSANAIVSSNLEVQSTAAQILGQLCKRSLVSGLHKDEAASILKALLDAVVSNTSSTSGSGIGSSSGSSSQRLVEDASHVKFYTALLVALSQAVYEDKQGWQGYAGQLTEAARKLFLYGTHQPIQQQQQVVAKSPSGTQKQKLQQSPAGPASAIGSSSSSSSSSSSAQSTVASPSKPRYVPPHMRAAAPAGGQQQPAAAAPPAAPQQQQQQQDVNSDPESTSEWSDISDSEQQQRNNRRSNSSIGSSRSPGLNIGKKGSSRDTELEQQQQQALAAQDPIKSYRVRVALLQLLQCLVQIDAKALHPYLSALLPSQQPLMRKPLSPHLVTLLMYDPCNKVRQLSAAVISALLEGPAARALLAVAEARSSKPQVRGFTTLSTSLGQMLLSLHTGLLAAITTWQQQQQHAQQQQQTVLELMSSSLLTSVLRALCCLVQVTPYDRFPPKLLAEAVDSVWDLWQQLQQQEAAAAAVGEDYGSSSVTAAVAVLAQALSTRKPSAAVEVWLIRNTAAGAAAVSNGNPSNGSSNSNSRSLLQQLMHAAASARPLLRIEALAALRGCSINYPAVVSAAGPAVVEATGAAAKHSAVSTGEQHSSSSGSIASWKRIIAAVQYSVEDTNQVIRTPRGSAKGSPAAAAGSSTEVSASTSPEDKAAQHAVKLLGDWLAAAWTVSSSSSNSSRAGSRTVDTASADMSLADLGEGSRRSDACDQSVQGPHLQCLVSMWSEVTNLLLSDQICLHPNYMIRSAAAGVLADIPAAVWQQLLPAQQQRILSSLAAAAATDSVTAARAAACKVLGSLVLLPGMLQDQQRLLLLLEPVGSSIRDSAVSVRLSASWAIANACDALQQPVGKGPHVAAARPSGTYQPNPESVAAATAAGVIVSPAVLQLLCQSALTASGDSEKVRANGIRAVGVLLAAWQLDWGLSSSKSSSNSSSSSSSSDWGWVHGWLRSATALLQSCLAARSMKVVWNAAYAAARLLANAQLHAAAEVSPCIPGILLVLVVLVRDSSNYKIKIHAAAALGAVQQRCVYGEVFSDAVLVLAAALDALDSGSNSSSSDISSNKSAATAGSSSSDVGMTEEDGTFPNFRYVPALQAQLQQSLLHMLAMLQPTDATRLREPLQRRRQQLLQLLQQHTAASDAIGSADTLEAGTVHAPVDSNSSNGRRHGQQRAVAGAAATAAVDRQHLPSDPFGQGAFAPEQQPQQQAYAAPAVAGWDGSGSNGRLAAQAVQGKHLHEPDAAAARADADDLAQHADSTDVQRSRASEAAKGLARLLGVLCL